MEKTAFISIISRPNVGKSTLMNSLLGEKVSIVSPKPQTTRNRIAGILTEGENQFVFLDTPGVHKAKNRLGDYMMKSVRSTVRSADAVILIADAAHPAGGTEKNLIEQIKHSELPSILVLNKIDLYNREKIAETIAAYASLYSFDAVVPTSAEKDKNVDAVIAECEKFLHEEDWMFPDDISTDQPERQIAAEIIREKLLRCLSDEIPHGTAVVMEDFDESEEDIIRLRATIYCEREAHKRIIIGKGGSALKRTGTAARVEMEDFFQKKVFLQIFVKVDPDWRESRSELRKFGYEE